MDRRTSTGSLPWVPENLYASKDGKRQFCKKCMADYQRRYQQRKRERQTTE